MKQKIPSGVSFFFVAFLMLLLLPAVVSCASEQSPVISEAEVPRERLEQYRMARYITERMNEFKAAHKKNPGSAKTVKWVYLYGTDQKPAEGYVDRINEWVDTFDAYFDSEMRENFFPPCHPATERGSDGKIKFYEIAGSKPKRAYGNDWVRCGLPMYQECRNYFLKENAFDMFDEVVCLVTNRLENDRGEVAREGAEYADIHGKGGTAFLLDHPKLYLKNITSTEILPFTDDYSRIRSAPTPLWNLVSYWVGNVPHEFLHALGIQHNRSIGAEAKRGIALMGMGTSSFLADRRQSVSPSAERAVLTFADCARLVSHPVFSCVNDGYGEKCSVTIRDFQIKADSASSSVTASGQVASSINGEPYLVLFYTDPEANPNDNWDSYTAPLWTGVVNRDGSFSVKADLREFQYNGRWRGRILICMTNGNYVNVPHWMFRGLTPDREIRREFTVEQTHDWGDPL